MQREVTTRVASREHPSQQFSEEVVVPVERLFVVERDDEQPVPLQPMQHLGGVGAGGERVAEWRGEFVQHGRIEEEADPVIGLALEHFDHEKSATLRSVPAKMRMKSVGWASWRMDSAAKLHTRGPAFGSICEHRCVVGDYFDADSIDETLDVGGRHAELGAA